MLKRLTLKNFQGIESLDIAFGGNTAIYGDNGTGKTTVFNAVTWLLFGTPSTGAKGFSPKTEETHNLDHIAEAVFGDITLKKVYHETYTQKRGQAKAEFTGHTTDYFIDGVPCKEKEYTAKVESIFTNAEKSKILMMPDYFATMKWEDRRKILFDVCGDIADSDIMSPELVEIIGKYTVDDYRKILKSHKTEVNKELNTIPARIDEATRAIPESVDVASLTEERSAINAKIAYSGKDTRRAEMQAKLKQAEIEYTTACSAETAAYNAACVNKERQIAQLEGKKAALESDIYRLTKRIADAEKQREALIEQYTEVANRKWTDAEYICPTCGQIYPETLKEELRAKFNANKSAELEKINADGQACSKSVIESLKDDLVKKQNELDILSENMEALKAEPILKPEFIPFRETETAKQIQTEIDNLPDNGGDVESLKTRAREIDMMLTKAETAKGLKCRIAELEEQERTYAAEIERIDQETAMCEEFVRAKVKALTERINSRFKTVQFRLFSEQINGGLKDDCEVLIPCNGTLVPYAFANNAAKINAGLEIIDTLGEYYGIRLPVFVDNAESVTSLYKPNTQVVRLIVSSDDEQLRVVAND